MDIKEVRANAKERMKGFCRVCPVCDGRACAGETPGMGGIGTGSAFKNNVAALAGVRLNMRLIHEVKKPVTETEVLGFRLRLPVLAAPIGGTSFNMGGALSEAEYARAIVSGCREAGIVGCVGDARRMNCTKRGMPPSPPKAAGGFRSSSRGKARNWSARCAGPQPPEPVCSVWTSTQPG